MKLVILDGYTLNPGDLSFDKLKEFADITIYDRTPPELVIERIGDAELILTNKTIISKEVLESTNLKYIGILATGFNVVELDIAKVKGIVVSNVPAYSTDAVAQFTFALLLEMCHHVGAHSDGVQAGDWVNSKDFCYWNYPLIELKGKTIGLIGFGQIGQATAKLATAFGLNVLFYNRSKKDAPQNCKQVELDYLLNNADIVSIHCPLTEQTRELINKDTIAKMKDGVILINTARASLVVEEDLLAALTTRKVYAAGLDATSYDNIRTHIPLMDNEYTRVTAHIAWFPMEARLRDINVAAENLKNYIKGTPTGIIS